MTVWRDVQAAGEALRQRYWQGKVRVMGADETAVRLRGKEVAVGLVVDAQTGQTIGVDLLVNGRDAAAFERWLLPYVGALGAEVLVSDDLSTYKPVAERLDLEQQVCLAHVGKNVARRLKQIAAWEAVKAKLKALLKALPLDGGQQLVALEKEVWAEPKLKALVVDLGQKWPSLVLHKQQPGVPATNNATERAIGRTKIRYKTTRGFKSQDGCLNAFALTQWLYTPAAQHDAATLLQVA
jgi:transposase-like protein